MLKKLSQKAPYFSIVKLSKIGNLSDNEAHFERQSVFQLETLCNYA